MSKISVGPSQIIVSDYHLGSCRSIESMFEVTDPFYNRYPLGMYYDETENKLYLSKNIDIPRLEYLLNAKAVYDIECNRKEHVKINLTSAPRDEEQKTALRFMIGNGEFSNCSRCSQLGLYLNTGKGKTYSSIAASTYFNMRSIIITSLSDWLKQWRSEIFNFTDTKENEVLIIQSKAKMQYFIKNPDKSLKYKYFLITHSLINSFASDNGWKSINDFMKSIHVGIKFIDEAHMNFENICKIDFFTRVWKTYYITATPTKSSDEEKIVYGNYFKNMRCIDLFNPDVDPHTHYKALVFESKMKSWEISNMKTAYGLNRVKYSEWLVNNEEFQKVLHVLMNIIKKKRKTLIYIATNHGIDVVKNWIEHNYPEYIGNIGVFTSVVNSSLKRNELDNKIILSTTKSFGAAVDCKGLELTINAAEPFKSEVLARQTLGRTRDDNTMYIDLVDWSLPDTKRYYYEKLPVFRKYALSVHEIRLSPTELDEACNRILLERMNSFMQPPYWCFQQEPLVMYCASPIQQETLCTYVEDFKPEPLCELVK